MKGSTKSKSSEKGVSLDPDDAVVGGGLFGAGSARAKKHRFGFFDYNGKRKAVPALLVEYVRDDEKYTESYTVGNGWKPSADGLRLVAKAGQSGLNDNCKCMLYLKALKEAGMPKGYIGDDISVLDGIDGELIRQPIEAIEDDKGGGKKKPSTVLVFDEVSKAPWGKGSKKSSKPADDDDDEDAADEDEDTDADEDDEEDEDEKPTKAKSKSSAKTSSAKSKKSKSDDDDEDEDEEEEEEEEATDDDDEDEDQVEAGVEALIVALDDGPLKLAKVSDAILLQLKKHPQRKAIAALVATEKFAAKEKGWSYDKKKKVLSLDE